MSEQNPVFEQDEEVTVTLTLDDGSEMECLVLTIFPVGDLQYIALLPMEEVETDAEGEVFLYRFKELEKICRNFNPRFDIFVDGFLLKYVDNVDKIVDKFTTKDCPHIGWLAKIDIHHGGFVTSFTEKTVTIIYLDNEIIVRKRFNRDKILGYYPTIL